MSPGRTYSITIRQPRNELCFIEMEWRSIPFIPDESTWITEMKKIAQPVIESELHWLGLPSETVLIEGVSPFENGVVVVYASSGNMPTEELKARVKEIFAAVPRGQRPPKPIYKGNSEFPEM